MTEPQPGHRSHELRLCATTGALSAGIAVALGAFGAHTLRSTIAPEMLAVFETGVRYQFYHAAGMIATGIAGLVLGGAPRRFLFAGWAFLAGSVIFSGSLYLIALSGTTSVGAITPIGGLLFIAGWLLLANAIVHRRAV
jgi:uncharacterized membrane protein YgdD (TMEM256/DUF423 family)